uniref:Uncharacterized protein n=1 Tax=Anguilla anguilla TaxID=7936 RepID=A0A0E9Q808_ANGAN
MYIIKKINFFYKDVKPLCDKFPQKKTAIK